MKVENNSVTPLSSQNTDAAQRVDKKVNSSEVSSVSQGRDRADVSENARLLAKARAALESNAEVENARVEMLRNEIKSGDYSVQVEEIARKMVHRFTSGT